MRTARFAAWKSPRLSAAAGPLRERPGSRDPRVPALPRSRHRGRARADRPWRRPGPRQGRFLRRAALDVLDRSRRRRRPCLAGNTGVRSAAELQLGLPAGLEGPKTLQPDAGGVARAEFRVAKPRPELALCSRLAARRRGRMDEPVLLE